MLFDEDSPETRALIDWWRDLEDRRGERAELRRADSPEAVAFLPAFHRLLRAIEAAVEGRVHPDRLAAIAGLAAHVRADEPNTAFAELMARSKPGSGSAPVSRRRFRQLLDIDDDRDRLYRSLRRILRMTGHRANLRELARGVYYWNRFTRRDWAYTYYANAPQASPA